MTNSHVFLTFLLSFLVTCDAAINCYYGVDQTVGNQHAKNIVKISCPNDLFCFKQARIDKKQKIEMYSYGCGVMAICSQPTCLDDGDGYRTCCCTSDYCNSTGFLSIFIGFLVVSISVL